MFSGWRSLLQLTALLRFSPSQACLTLSFLIFNCAEVNGPLGEIGGLPIGLLSDCPLENFILCVSGVAINEKYITYSILLWLLALGEDVCPLDLADAFLWYSANFS